MKKYSIFSLLLLLMACFTSCKEDDIVLTSELPQFELREGLMLLEVIVPYGTGINDDVYIVGDFNGGLDAVGDPTWRLERGNPATGVPAKFGIYLNPSTFMNGKTLADGYYFYDIQKGPEKNIDNEPVLHYDFPGLGQRLNVFVNYWEDDFNTPENPDDIVHDGYAVYVINNTGWTDLAMYAWGDAEAFGGWPGITPTGKVEINGVNYQYFDTGASNEGLNLNLIFNNNGNGVQLPDVNVTLNKDFYFELTADGAVEIDPNDSIKHDGYAVFVYDNTGWDAVMLYMWGDVNNLNGDWPGMPPTGTQVVNGIGYIYFDFGEANTGLNENLIFNNNDNGVQLPDFNFTIDRNLYVEITASGVTEIDPETFTPGGTPDEPDTPDNPDPAPDTEYTIYVENNTTWDSFYLYAWGQDQTFGDWPGQQASGTREINGVTYLMFTVPGTGGEEHLIFNNNAGTQVEQGDMVVTLDRDWYISVTDGQATFLDYPEFKIYVENQIGWSDLYLYGWGDSGNSFFGDWPGMHGTDTTQVNGVTYTVFTYQGNGMSENLIFNNNSGDQTPDFNVPLNKDYYLVITADKEVKYKE